MRQRSFQLTTHMHICILDWGCWWSVGIKYFFFFTITWVSFDQSTSNIARHIKTEVGIDLGVNRTVKFQTATVLKNFKIYHNLHLLAKNRKFKIYHNALVAWKPGFVTLPRFLFHFDPASFTQVNLHVIGFFLCWSFSPTNNNTTPLRLIIDAMELELIVEATTSE